MASTRITLSLAALLAACASGAFAQPSTAAPPSNPAASANAEHKGMHQGMHQMTAKEREQHRKAMRDKMAADGKDADCNGMMDKHKKMAQGAAANDKSVRCGMPKQQ